MGGLVIRGAAKIKGSLGSGAGDELLTKDASSGELGTVSGSAITALQQNCIFVGNASNLPSAVAVSGDATIVSSGALTIANSAINNAKVAADAAIALSKLATLTASRAIVSDGSGVMSVSSVTSTELGYLSGVSSSLQTQINAKQATITGGASTIVSSNLTANRALLSGTTGKVEVSSVTATELGYISGVTSAIQTQINAKLSVSLGSEVNGDILYRSGGSWTNLGVGSNGEVLTVVAGMPEWAAGTSNGIPSGGTTAQYLRKSSNTDYAVEWHTSVLADVTDVTASADDVNLLEGLDGTITTTELSYLAGVTSAIQTQINNKLGSDLAYHALYVGGPANTAQQVAAGAENSVLTIISGHPTWQTPPTPGTFSGPVSSTDNAIVRFNGVGGDAGQNSGVIIDDSDNVSGIGTLSSGQHSILNQAALRLYETGSTNSVAVRASGTMTSDYTITLPAAAPGSNTYLKYDGTNYVWATASGGGTALQQKEESGTTYSVTDADDGYIIYFTNASGCTVTLPDSITTDISFTTVRADGAGLIAHVAGGTSVIYTIGSEQDIEDEYGAATWVKKTATDWYGWGSLGPAGGGGTGAFADLTGVPSDNAALDAVLDAKAPLASPTFTGIPTAPTAASGTNNTQVATTAFVTGAINDLIASAPAGLNTLDELAAAIGDDVNFSTTVTNALAAKAAGAASSTDNAIARFDSTTGKILQNSGATINDSGEVTAVNVTITGQAATSSTKNTTYVDDTGKIYKASFIALDTTNQKVTQSGVDDLEATVQHEWLNNSGTWIMRVLNGLKVSFNGTSSFLEVQSGSTSGNAGIICLDDQDIAYRIKDNSSFDYFIAKSSDGGYGKASIIKQKLVLDEGAGFETVRRQFKLTLPNTTAATAHIVGSISVPSGYALKVMVREALAFATNGSVISTVSPFGATLKNNAGTTTAATITAPTMERITATTGGFSIAANDTTDTADITFTNETGTGRQYDVVVDLDYILYPIPT
jgi:hypothetical protein